MDISIVIVSWNNRNYLEPCLRSIYEANNGAEFEIVIVDNGSSDGTQTFLREHYSQITLIENNKNLGLSKATNQGIQATVGRYVLLYNNDTLMQPETLDKFVKFMDEHPDAGAAGGRLLNGDGSFQASHNNFPSVWSAFLDVTRLWILINKNYPSEADSNEIQVVNWISSACLVVRRKVLEQVGLLDEDYFLYGDEMDLQYRMKQSGWKIFYIPYISTIHFGSVSLNRWRKRRLFYRGILLFNYKNGRKLTGFFTRGIFLIFTLLKLFLWHLLRLVPKHKKRALDEIPSLVSVVNLCFLPIRAMAELKY